MTLSELLKFVRHNKLRDKAAPPLWSDATIVLYLNEGQDRFAAQTDYLIESDSELSLSAGIGDYPLEDGINMVYSARLEGYENVRLQPSTEGWTPESTYAGRPVRYTLERATRTVRFYPVPDEDYTALMRVARAPLALSLDATDRECELPDDMLITVAEWAAYRCFTEDDADGRNDLSAEKALMRYNEGTNRFKRDNYRLRTGFGARAHGQRVK